MKTNAPAMSANVYHDVISRRAREIWHARHSPKGKDVEIWLEAEKELFAAGAIPPSPPSQSKSGKTARVAADDIDELKLLRRLEDFGERPARSVTALGHTRALPPGLPID